MYLEVTLHSPGDCVISQDFYFSQNTKIAEKIIKNSVYNWSKSVNSNSTLWKKTVDKNSCLPGLKLSAMFCQA